MMRLRSYIIIGVFTTSLIISHSDAQSIWKHRDSVNTIGLEVLAPSFDGSLSYYSGYIVTLSGRFKVSNTNHLVIEVPFAHGAYTFQTYVYNGSTYVPSTVEQSSDAIGNPYIGMEFSSPGSSFFGEVGARIPITPESSFPASSVAVNADIDRFEAYVPDLVQTSLALNYNPKISRNFGFRLRVGPLFDISLKRASGSTELYLLYSEQMFFLNELLDIGFGFSGRAILTNPRTNDRTIDMFEIAGKMHAGKFLPGATLRLPLDQSLSNVVSLTYGFTVEYLL
jgi:hypothetical protein